MKQSLDALAERLAMGKRLKAEFIRLGLSPEAVAIAIDRSRSSIFNYLSGARIPDAMAVRALALYCDIDVLFVLGLQPQKLPTKPHYRLRTDGSLMPSRTS